MPALTLLLELGNVGKSDIIDLIFTVNLTLKQELLLYLLPNKGDSYHLMLVINDMPAIILGGVIRKCHIVMVSILSLVDIQRDNTISVATIFNHDDEIEWDKE